MRWSLLLITRVIGRQRNGLRDFVRICSQGHLRFWIAVDTLGVDRDPNSSVFEACEFIRNLLCAQVYTGVESTLFLTR